MDPDKRTRLFTTAGIVVLVAALGFAGYSMATRALSRARDSWRSPSSASIVRSDAGPLASVAVGELGQFTAVSAVGGWKITVEPGDQAVEVAAAAGVVDLVRVAERAGTLHLELAPGTISLTDALEARITTPDLRRMEIRGGASVRIVGFDLAALALRIDGAATVTAADSTIGSLDLVVNGASNVDLSQSPVVDARVQLDGASNLTIAMAGGELSGALRGVGNVTYTGNVTSESIRVEGIGRVRRR